MPNLIEQLSNMVGKFSDRAYKSNWMTYAIIIIVGLIVIVILKS